MTKVELQDLIVTARGIAAAEANRVPNASVYPLVLGLLDEIEAAMPTGPRNAFEAARPLGVLAARELDEAGGPAGDLGAICFKIRDGLRILAGLPYYA